MTNVLVVVIFRQIQILINKSKELTYLNLQSKFSFKTMNIGSQLAKFWALVLGRLIIILLVSTEYYYYSYFSFTSLAVAS